MVIIDAYRGGSDTGKLIDGRYEKDILLDISKYMSSKLDKKKISNYLVRSDDVSLSDADRINIINKVKSKNDLIIQNRISEDGKFNIIYSLRSNDYLARTISNDLANRGYSADKYFQRRLPVNTQLDFYNIIRNTIPNETIIIEYNNLSKYPEIVDSITNSINNYINKDNIYIVKKGDSLYKIAKKFNVSVDEIKNINNISSNLINIGDELIIPKINDTYSENNINYIVKRGDTLYKLSRLFGVSVSKLKEVNNLDNNILTIGMNLIIPSKRIVYTVKKGDSLYRIARNFNVSVDSIKKINNLEGNLISLGQELIIPK